MRLRAARVASWGIGFCGAIAATPSLRSVHGRVVTVARALMPWAGLAAAPLAVVARLGGRRIAAASGVAVATASALLCRPLIHRRWRRGKTTTPRVDSTISVVHANLLSANRHVVDAAARLSLLRADVLTFSEYTPAHATNLKSTSLVRRYPHRVELVAPRSSGTAVWSRHPLTVAPSVQTTHETVVVDVHAPQQDLRLIVVHTQSPVAHYGDWRADLEQLAELAPTAPSVMIGDFNAGWWHPELRSLLGPNWRDAHVLRGDGLSGSWPTAAWNLLFRWLPPFVRLDHALVTDDLAVVDTIDLDVPGSDHLGLLVSVAPLSR